MQSCNYQSNNEIGRVQTYELIYIEREIENRWTWLQQSHVKGKKSSCLQSETEQCLPRFGNSGVPIWTNAEERKRILSLSLFPFRNWKSNTNSERDIFLLNCEDIAWNEREGKTNQKSRKKEGIVSFKLTNLIIKYN